MYLLWFTTTPSKRGPPKPPPFLGKITIYDHLRTSSVVECLIMPCDGWAYVRCLSVIVMPVMLTSRNSRPTAEHYLMDKLKCIRAA